ncbi:MAG: porin [Leptothrix sp. (in: b-proteobacteria)]
MKKTLIALAALAAVGTVSAQTVVLGGVARYAYQRSAADTSVKDNTGFAVPDLIARLTVSEDVGVAKLTGVFGLDLGDAGRNAAVTRNDYTITAAGNFGSVDGYSKEAANQAENALSGLVSLPNGLDSTASSYKSLASHSNVKGLGYTSTEIVPGLKARVAYSTYDQLTDSTNPALVNPAARGFYTGKNLTVSYAAGPFKAALGYTQYNNKNTDAAATKNTHKVDLFGTYDLGVAKLGLGYVKTSSKTGADVKPTIIASAYAPFGAYEFGVDYAQKSALGTTPKVSYTALGAHYNLSKATFLEASVGGFKGQTAANIAGGAPSNVKQYRVGITKNF